MEKNLKRVYENWILFLMVTVLLVAGVVLVLSFMALFLL